MPIRDRTQEQKALQRAREAELSVVLKNQQTEAQEAQNEEQQRYMAYLAADEALSEPQKRFLSSLALSGLPYRACFDSGTPPRTYYNWLRDNEDFRIMVEEVKKFAADRLEQVAVDLATGAYVKPLVSQGKIAAYERVYDSRVLLALLKSRKPAEFTDRVDVTSNGHTLVKLVDKDAWDSV